MGRGGKIAPRRLWWPPGLEVSPMKASRTKSHVHLVTDRARPAGRVASIREENPGFELEARGILPTAEYPVLYRALGKTGFGLFLYLSEPLDLQTLDRLAKNKRLSAAMKRVLA
jgi:hypothetical protein